MTVTMESRFSIESSSFLTMGEPKTDPMKGRARTASLVKSIVDVVVCGSGLEGVDYIEFDKSGESGAVKLR